MYRSPARVVVVVDRARYPPRRHLASAPTRIDADARAVSAVDITNGSGIVSSTRSRGRSVESRGCARACASSFENIVSAFHRHRPVDDRDASSRAGRREPSGRG